MRTGMTFKEAVESGLKFRRPDWAGGRYWYKDNFGVTTVSGTFKDRIMVVYALATDFEEYVDPKSTLQKAQDAAMVYGQNRCHGNHNEFVHAMSVWILEQKESRD